MTSSETCLRWRMKADTVCTAISAHTIIRTCSTTTRFLKLKSRQHLTKSSCLNTCSKMLRQNKCAHIFFRCVQTTYSLHSTARRCSPNTNSRRISLLNQEHRFPQKCSAQHTEVCLNSTSVRKCISRRTAIWKDCAFRTSTTHSMCTNTAQEFPQRLLL